jgi:hydrogenase nickel incorporation protein HypB
MFRAADLVLLSKSDLLPVLDDFKPENARRYLRNLANPAPVFELSARTGAGLDQWLHWLFTEISQLEHPSGALDAVTTAAAPP